MVYGGCTGVEWEENMMKSSVDQYVSTLKSLMDSIRVGLCDGTPCSFDDGVSKTLDVIKDVKQNNHKLMFIGNGASASIASHMATDFWKTNEVRAMAFNDSSGLTCISNDFGYKHVFEKPIEMFADEGDILVAISSSGQSENILRGAQAAQRKNIKIITLSGFKEDNPLRQLGDINFYLPASEYGYVEVLHHAICHCWIDLFAGKVKESEEMLV